jgi:hypothetical protein
MTAADDYFHIARIANGLGSRSIEDAEEQARMILAEVDVLRARVNLKEAELAAAEVALRSFGYQGAMTR